MRDGLGGAAGAGEHDAEVETGIEEFRAQGEGALEVRDRPVGDAGGDEGGGEVAVRFGVVRARAQGGFAGGRRF